MKEGFKRTAKMKIDNKVFTGAAAEITGLGDHNVTRRSPAPTFRCHNKETYLPI